MSSKGAWVLGSSFSASGMTGSGVGGSGMGGSVDFGMPARRWISSRLGPAKARGTDEVFAGKVDTAS